jgi:beta-phosphoglucomutase
MKIKAILFDMDGVLVDAKDWHYEALNKALRLFGYEISRYDHLVTYDGLPTRVKLEMLTRERGLPVALHPFINEMKQKYTLEYAFNNCKPRFEHEFALSRLKHEGYRLAVCSNAVRDSVEIMLEKTNLLGYFEVVLSNQDIKKSKPDPEIYDTAVKRLGLKSAECLTIEDNEKGIKSAEAAGTHVLAVKDVSEVNYANIKAKIAAIEKGG